MSEKRPNVFPNSQGNKPQNTQEEQPKVQVDSDYETKKLEVAEEVYLSSMNETGMAAVDAMRKRTEEQIRLRNEALKKNEENIQSYQDKIAQVERSEPIRQTEPVKTVLATENKPVLKSEINENYNTNLNLSMNMSNEQIKQISEPQYNAAFDLLPLPSEGKLYKNKKSSVKVAYMTAADENILTSPNLLESGEFLEILINRKLLEPNLRYKDLHIGDRNAIMLWLRATSYGEMYPVTLLDKNNSPFDTEIDLSALKVKKLNIEPDDEGYFGFKLPVSKSNIKFKLFTVGDVMDIEAMIEMDTKNESIVNNTLTYTLEKHIVDIDGNRDRGYIKDFIQNMRIRDSKELREYINSIDCGVDLEIEARTPGGESVKTFLPLNLGFFWPDIEL
jgi:hypothetical protein